MGTVYAIKQDRHGFVWLGSENALVRYDGYTLKKFGFYDVNKPEGYTNILYARDIIEDSHGVIWVASGIGLLHYDETLDRFVRTPDHPSVSAVPLSGLGIRDLTEIPDGKLAVATYSGLYVIDPYSGEGVHYSASQANTIEHDRVRKTLYDGDHTLWVGVGSGLDQLNLNTGQFSHFKPIPSKPHSIPDNSVTSIVHNADGTLWLGTYKGLIHFNPGTGASKRFDEHSSPQRFLGGEIWDLLIDSEGYLWVATDGGGLIVIDQSTIGSNDPFYQFQHNPSLPSSLSSNVVRVIFEDRQGAIWAGNYPSGVNYFNRFGHPIKYLNNINIDADKAVTAIISDEGDNLWIGTDGGGLNRVDSARVGSTTFRYNPEDVSSPSSDAIVSLMIDSENTLWAGTWGGGVFKMNLDSHLITRLDGDSERPISGSVSTSVRLNNDKVWCVFEDRAGYIWMCTDRGGLSRYDKSKGDYIHYTHSEGDPASISSNHVWTVLEDSFGLFWVGTTEGLGLLDRSTGKFTNYMYDATDPGSLLQSSIRHIHEDKAQRLWLATNTGLKLYHRDSNTFSSFGLAEGFFNESIKRIIEDDRGWLWLSTNSGVIAFDPESHRVKNHTRTGGSLIGGIYHNAAFMTKRGQALFGGVHGLFGIDSKNTQAADPPPQVMLTDFQILNEPVVVGSVDSPLTSAITRTKDITLLPKDSVFSFEFSALSYSLNEKIEYAYKLDGFDSKWNFVGTRRTATYTNLDSGQYTFSVKSSNSDGVWSDRITRIRIRILPRWWSTWWAYILYVLLFAAVVIHYGRNRSMRLLIQEKTDDLILNRRLSQRITKVLEDERKAIAHEVHDNINSTIIATRMITQSIERLVQVKDVNVVKIVELTQRADQQLSETYDYFRSMLRRIRPETIETLGFDGAISELVKNYNHIHLSCNFLFDVVGVKVKVHEDISIGLYRIAQEAITNAIKHARPTTIKVSVVYKIGLLQISILDNGCGFGGKHSQGLGLEHMRERALSLRGGLTIQEGEGGTLVSAEVPC